MKEFKFKISGQDYSATVAEENAGSLVVTVNGQAYQVEVPQTKAAAPVMARGNAGAAQAGCAHRGLDIVAGAGSLRSQLRLP